MTTANQVSAMTTVNLGMPAAPAAPLAPRRVSRTILLRHPHHPVAVGGDAPVSVQSMTTTPTSDVNATLQQIAELTASGCQVVRVAQDDPAGRAARGQRLGGESGHPQVDGHRVLRVTAGWG